MGKSDPNQIPLIQRLTRNAFMRTQRQHVKINTESHVVRFDSDIQDQRSRRSRKTDSVRTRYPRLSGAVQGYKYTEKLLELVINESFDEAKALLEGGTDINVADEGTKTTALHIAATSGQVGMLRLLLDKGADVNAQDNTEQSPLHLAVRKDHLDCCQLLLDHANTDVNLCNKENNTALHIAAKEGRYNACSIILDKEQIKVNAKNKRGMTALHLAAQENHPQVLQLLLEKGGCDWKIQDSNLYLALHYAAQKGFPECCQVLMSSGIKDNKEKQLTMSLKDGKTALMLAAKNGQHKCCEKLKLSNMNAKDKMGNTALHYATAGGFEITVVELLEMGANPNVQNREGCAPVLAAAGKRVGCLKALLDKGANLNISDKSRKGVLHYAAEKNAEDSMKLLLEMSDITEILDRGDKDDCTALHLAIKREAVECALLLLEKGASATLECVGGMTPLHLAADRGYTILCEKLFAKPEVQVSKENEMKATPLHLAALHGSVDVCQMLLRKGARQTAVDVHGRTALHLASGKGNASVVKFLCRKGVPNKAKDDTDSNALHLAAASSEEGALECCKILSCNAKMLNWDMNRDKKLPIDRAFEKGNDETFNFLLKKLAFKENHDDRMLTLHQYMHDALEEQRITVVEAIIDSDWWEAGFTGENRHHCQNFRTLIELYPDLALKVQDKCVIPLSDSETKYDFRLYNDNYYIPEASESRKRALSPFDPETELVVKKARQFTTGLEWKNNHPLALMVTNIRNQNLQHPLSKAWMLQKWRSYVYKIFLLLLMHELIYVSSLIGFMIFLGNDTELNDFTKGQSTNIYNNTKFETSKSQSSESMSTSKECNRTYQLPLRITLIMAMCVTVMLEFNYMIRLKNEYLSPANHGVRVLRDVCTLVILVPQSFTQWNCIILNDTQWQFGIAAILLAGLHLINTLNELPMLSVFMPITHRFLKSFFKVLFYIIMLIFIFAVIFYLLLRGNKAFQSLPQAMVKTIVWIVGDLAYDDTFLKNEDKSHDGKSHELKYPIMTNTLFVVFVTVIGGFIVNLIITQPSNKRDDFRERAYFHLAASRVALFLRLDICFPFFRKMRTAKSFVDGKKYKNHRYLTRKLLMLDVKDEVPEAASPVQLHMEEQTKQITMLLNLQIEQRDEIQELKHQLRLIVNKTLEQS